MAINNPLDLIKGSPFAHFGDRVGSVDHSARTDHCAPGYEGGFAEDRITKAGSGAGSRGGNVIGHTGSGKPIYAGKHESPASFHEAHKDWSSSDHTDAKEAHDRKSARSRHDGVRTYHEEMTTAHWVAAQKDSKYGSPHPGATPEVMAQALSNAHPHHEAAARSAEASHKRRNKDTN